MKKGETHLAIREGWISIVVNTVLFGLKYWAGIVSGSIALIADAWHTLSDSVSSVILLIGVKASSKRPDREHPFGHGRAELIAAIMIGVLLAIVAFSFLQESISKLLNREKFHYGTVAVVVTIISILTKEALAQYALWAGKKADSNILKADAWHHRSDAISSIIILIGIFIGSYYWWIDGVLGIIVSLLIFYAAYEILKDSIDPILGKRPDEMLISGIKNICEDIGGSEISAHHFHMHDYGFHTELTFHIRLPGEMLLGNSHSIVTSIEEKIRESLQMEVTIHVDPK